MKHILFDANGHFSWRKGLTLLAALLFAFAVIGYEIGKFKELPESYMIIIGGIFGSYFFRRTIDALKKNPTNGQS